MDEYEWIKARVLEGRELIWTYKLTDTSVWGSDSFDEEVSEYTEDEIRELTMDYLDVPKHQKHLIDVEYL